jgi:hypothetical protein
LHKLIRVTGNELLKIHPGAQLTALFLQVAQMSNAFYVPTEQQEAEALAAYCRVKGYAFTHIPNETGSDPAAIRRAIRMKRAGVSKGFCDYLIFKDGQSFAIELKRQRGGTVSAEQRVWLAILSAHGFRAAICHGFQESIEFLEAKL